MLFVSRDSVDFSTYFLAVGLACFICMREGHGIRRQEMTVLLASPLEAISHFLEGPRAKSPNISLQGGTLLPHHYFQQEDCCPGLTFLPPRFASHLSCPLFWEGSWVPPTGPRQAFSFPCQPARPPSPPSSRSARQGCIRARGEDRTALLPPSTIKENIKSWPPPGNCLN